MIKIDYEKCCWQNGKCTSCACGGGCVDCVEACAVGALSRKKRLEIDIDKCTECGACVISCKHGALSLE